MKLLRFEITRFRKFDSKVTIHFDGYTTLIGANNEGKTSICDALEIFFSHLGTNIRYNSRVSYRSRQAGSRTRFNYSRDFPLARASQKRRHPTEFVGTFSIDDGDREKVKDLGWDELKKEFSIKVYWNYQTQRLDIECKDLPDDKEKRKLQSLSLLVKEKVRFVSIPAIREQDTLLQNISTLFDESVRIQIEKSRKIKRVREQLTAIIDPAVQEVTEQLKTSVKEFLPSLEDLEISWKFEIERVVNLETIFVNDGHKTPIYLKGDGIKNLLWLGNLTFLADQQADDKSVSRIFMIEEPEAHLNSSILYKLKQQLLKLSENGTVITTTHSPVMLEFAKKGTAYLVADGKATPTQDKVKIAEALGIRVQENLRSNTVGLIVEGVEEEIAIQALARTHAGIKNKLDKVDIIKANGAGNIAYTYQQHKGLYQHLFVLIDKDAAGNQAKKDLETLRAPDSMIFCCPSEPGYDRAELEDLLDLEFVIVALSEIYGRKFDLSDAKATKRRYKGKFKEWIIPVVNRGGLAISDPEPLKYQLWDYLKKSPNIKVTESGAIYFKTIFETILGKI